MVSLLYYLVKFSHFFDQFFPPIGTVLQLGESNMIPFSHQDGGEQSPKSSVKGMAEPETKPRSRTCRTR